MADMRRSRRSRKVFYAGSFNPGMTSNLPHVNFNKAESVNFGLKNLGRTQAKWSNYKTEKWNDLRSSFNDYLGDLPNIVYAKLKEKEEIGALPSDLTKKSSINSLRTWINSLTYNANLNEVRGYSDNENEARGFTIRLYLDNYDKINTSMKQVMMRYLKEHA